MKSDAEATAESAILEGITEAWGPDPDPEEVQYEVKKALFHDSSVRWAAEEYAIEARQREEAADLEEGN